MKKLFLLIIALIMVISIKPQKQQDKNQSLLKKSVIYEVNIRQFTPEGNFKAFSTHLERLKELGVDILWVMPIYPIGVKNRKEPLGSYYSIRNFVATNQEFGTIANFKEMVNKAHKLGIKIIIDWVANHTSCDHEWLTQHPDWFIKDEKGNFLSQYDWTDTYKLDYSNQNLRNEMINSMKFWLTETKIDGFRCDMSFLVPLDFWESAIVELKKTKNDIFMLSESENANSCDKVFKSEYSWEFFHLTEDIVRGHKNVCDISTYLHKLDTNFSKNAYKMYFTSNHDENSWNGTPHDIYGDGHKAFYTLVVVMPGMPLIYSGQECGNKVKLKFFEKDPINWTQDSTLQEFYKEIISIKKQNQALWNGNDGGKLELLDINNNIVFAGKRELGNNKIVAIINLSKTEQNIRTEDLKLDESKIIFKSGDWNNNNIEPFGYFIFKL